MAALLSGKRGVIKPLLFVAGLLPLAAMAVGSLSVADPVEYLTRRTGITALQLLVATLLVTPLRRMTGWNSLIIYRRMIGLYAFFYAFLHFGVYVLLDLQLDFSILFDDIIKRKYITVGFIAFVLLLPLVATSNNAMIRRLGAKRWTKLHKAVYAISVLAAAHFWWQVKGNDVMEAMLYMAAIVALLALRFPKIAEAIQRKKAGRKPAA